MQEEVMNTSKYKPVNEWEEAGGEFYQEILPSKQSRCATTKRRQSGVDFKIKYWQQSTQKQSTHKPSDVQFAKLPDLSEVNTNEELIWEEILQIKYMPINMEQKKSLKFSLNSATKLRMIGFKQFKWKQRKFHQRLRLKWSEWKSNLELWSFSLNQIEGYFGSGVVSYFQFLRGLFFLNVFMFIVILLFIILPQITHLRNVHVTCSDDKYPRLIDNTFQIAQFIDPSMSPLFYGSYLHKIVYFYTDKNNIANSTDNSLTYDLSVAYLGVNGISICIVCILLLYAISCEFKKRLKNGKWQLCQYCNLIFCGWDFCTHYSKFTNIKHKAAFIALKQLLHNKREHRAKKSRNYILKRHITRVIINLTTFLMLILLCCSTYMLFNIQGPIQQKFFNSTVNRKIGANSTTESNANEFLQIIANAGNDVKLFLIELAPYLLIVIFNMILSVLFNYFRTLEQYSPSISIQITVVRNMLLRLTSIITVLYYITFNVVPQLQDQNSCWENYMGQQLYNFVIAEFFMQMLITFGINLPLSLCARRFKHNFVKMMQMFEVPKHMLDIIYIQSICWLGLFYSPGFPFLISIILFVIFYVKKFQCLVNSTLSYAFFPRSSAIAMFTIALFFTYVMVLVAIAFAFTSIKPSISCGLFRERNSIWEAIIMSYSHFPNFVKYIFTFFTTNQFIILYFLVLILLLYYYHTVADANKNLVEVLRNQLVLEGHDKQFLLNRLSVFIKQYQEKTEV